MECVWSGAACGPEIAFKYPIQWLYDGIRKVLVYTSHCPVELNSDLTLAWPPHTRDHVAG